MSWSGNCGQELIRKRRTHPVHFNTNRAHMNGLVQDCIMSNALAWRCCSRALSHRYIHIKMKWASWGPKIINNLTFVQPLDEANNKGNIKVSHYWPFYDRRWPPHKGPVMSRSFLSYDVIMSNHIFQLLTCLWPSRATSLWRLSIGWWLSHGYVVRRCLTMWSNRKTPFQIKEIL